MKEDGILGIHMAYSGLPIFKKRAPVCQLFAYGLRGVLGFGILAAKKFGCRP